MNETKKTTDIDIRAMIEKNSREAMCKWCHPDENGQFSAARFESPDQKGQVLVFFGGAELNVDLTMGTEHAMLKMGIFFCPMCGRRIRAEGEAQ